MSLEHLIERECLREVAETAAAPSPHLLRFLSSRRSVAPRHLVEPAPAPRELRAIFEAALTGPDHGGLRCWRLVEIPCSMRETLAALFEAAKLEEHPGASDDDRHKARAKAFNAPLLLAVLFKPDTVHPLVTVEEQLVALGAALQNMLLATHASGYAAMITSGRKIAAKVLQSAFAKAPGEKLVAFVSIGTPARTPAKRTPASIEKHFSIWDGSSC